MKEFEKQCQLNQEKFYENKIKPVDEKLDKVLKKLEEAMPTVKEINDFKTFFKIARQIGIGSAIFITTVGIIVGGILTIKEWIKK